MSWGSLVSIFGQMRVLVCWMAGEGYSRFADLDADAASRFLAALQERLGRGGQVLTIGTRAGYLVVAGPALRPARQAPIRSVTTSACSSKSTVCAIAASTGMSGCAPTRQMRLRRLWWPARFA